MITRKMKECVHSIELILVVDDEVNGGQASQVDIVVCLLCWVNGIPEYILGCIRTQSRNLVTQN